MATVYSLVCFGGLSGKTVTFTDTGDVVNLNNHGLRQGVTGIVFSTTGSLPTGITAGTTYYPRDGADANKFTIYPTKADALAGTNQVTFTGTGSGTHTVKSAYMLGLNSTQLSRYGNSGSERIYDGIKEWNTEMTSRATDSDIEVCEIGEIFTEKLGANYIVVNKLLAHGFIWSKVNGQRSTAFHNGIIDSGFILEATASGTILQISSPFITVDGFQISGAATNSGGLQYSVTLSDGNAMILKGVGASSTATGCNITKSGCNFTNSIITGFDIGCMNYSYNNYTYFANNLVCNNKRGMKQYSPSNVNGVLLNNVVVNNSTYNYERQSSPDKASRNVGELADRREISVDASTDIITLTGHAIISGAKVVLLTSGTLPSPLTTETVYYARDITTDTFKVAATSGGAAINIADTGSGTHYLSSVYDTKGDAMHIDMANKSSIWVDFDNGDYRPCAGSTLIDYGVDWYGASQVDIADNVRPNYQASTYPDNYWDVGPFEYDHGDGLVPAFTELTITAQVSLSGAEVRIYDLDNNPAGTYGTELAGTESHSAATYTYTGSTGNVIGIQIMQSGYEEFNQTITLENDTQSLSVTLRSDINA